MNARTVHQGQKTTHCREAADCEGLTVMPRYNAGYLALRLELRAKKHSFIQLTGCIGNPHALRTCNDNVPLTGNVLREIPLLLFYSLELIMFYR